LSIRSSHSRKQRTETQDTFNHPKTRGTALLTNLRCAATSMNLQYNCFKALFVEPADSANTTAQAIGRLHRIGQLREQLIYILTSLYTYDGYQQARAANKMYAQIAG
ncbi:hypothetical protein BGZ60DRAFT_333616, partial [Tricladium varicosporioides]